MAGRWIVQSIPSLINSDTNTPQLFVINSRGRHFSNWEEATAECDRLNAEEAAAEKLRAGVAALRKRLKEDLADCQEQADEASKDNDRAAYKFHSGMAEGVKLAMKLLDDVLKPSSGQGPDWIPVRERLPEEYGEYLLWDGGLGLGIFSHPGTWWDCDGKVEGVTHWQELPKGPEV